MALVDFNTFVSEVAPHLPGCPTSVIEAYIRKVTSDLCERARVWQGRITPVALTPGVYAYTLASPIVGAEVAAPIKVMITPSATDVPVELAPKTTLQAAEMFPTWPEDGKQGQPSVYVQTSPSTVELYLIPDSADVYTLSAIVALRPTMTATQCEESILSDYRRAIFHGVAHELMLLPDRAWSDAKTAALHGKQWEYFLYLAKSKVNKGFGRSELFVKQRPWA